MGKAIRRDWIKRQIAKGNIEIKTEMILTDDYAFDAASGCQKTSEWVKADINNFNDRDFQYKSGHAYWNDDHTEISWTMLCNHYYKLRLIK